MPYLLLMGKGAFLSSMADILERLRRSRWHWDGSWILLFTRLGTFRPLGLGTPRPSVCPCHLGIGEEFRPVHFPSSVAADQRHL